MTLIRKKRRVLHFITGLGVGGAETCLVRLLRSSNRDLYTFKVVAMIGGPMVDQISQLGVTVHVLNMDRRYGKLINGIRELYKIIRSWKPDLMHCWMYHANLIGGMLGIIFRIPVLWAVHNTNLDKKYTKQITIVVAKLTGLLSTLLAKKIVFVSKVSFIEHKSLGYSDKNVKLISNGFDLDEFCPSEQARAKIREELGVNEEALLVGLIARFDPLKDHNNFVKASGFIKESFPNCHFVLCGDGIDHMNKPLKTMIQQVDVADCTFLLGRRWDVSNLMAALDVSTLSSCGEAFPNVLGESMACGIPCVSTDVGDAAWIIGDKGKIVPVRDAEGLASAVMDLLNMPKSERYKLGLSGRSRIKTLFSELNNANQFSEVYQEILLS